MPTYSYKCPYCLQVQDHVRTIAERDDLPMCHNRKMERILVAPMVFVQGDICYDSPVDGRPITSKQARIEDLKRHGCMEYDPGIKQDYERRRVDAERDLDRKVDHFVEAEFERMPTHKRERLAAELEGGMTPEIVRQTPAQTSFKEATNV